MRLFLSLLLVLSVACGQSDTATYIPVRNFGAEVTTAWEAEAWEALRSLDAELDLDKDLFARQSVDTLITLAAVRRVANLGDPMQRLDEAAALSVDGSLSAVSRLRLAREYHLAGLPEKALEVASAEPRGADPQELQQLRAALEDELGAFLPPSGDWGTPGLASEATFDQRLARVLTALDSGTVGSLGRYVDEPEDAPDEQATEAQGPTVSPSSFAGGMLSKVLSGGGGCEEFADLSDSMLDVGDPLAGLSERGVSSLRSMVEQFLAAEARTPWGGDLGEIPMLLGLYEAESYWASEDTLALLMRGGRSVHLIVLALAPEGLRALSFRFYGDPAIEFLPVLGRGMQLVGRYREGSGGYLAAFVLDTPSLRPVYYVQGVHRGDIQLINVDADAAKEILLLVAGSPWGCTQCEAIYEGHIFDYHKADGCFGYAGSYETSVPLTYRAASFGFGMTSDMMLEVERNLSGPAGQLILEKESIAPGDLTEEDILELASAIDGELSLHVDAGRPLTVASYVRRLGDLIERSGVEMEELYLQARLSQAFHLFLGGDFAGSLEITEDPHIRDGLRAEADSRSAWMNLRLASLLTSGALDDGFEELTELAREVETTEAALEGNFALYYRQIGDHQSALEHARLSVSLAFPEANASSRNLGAVHAASAALSLGDLESCLTWLLRGVRWSREFNHTSALSGILQIAAQLALERELPTLAVLFLDEAITFSDPLTWSNHGAPIMLLYGRALEKAGNVEAALAAFRAADANATGPTYSAGVMANFHLSRLLADSDAVESKRYANRAVELIGSGRSSLSLESHKWSFLGDKDEIVSWAVELARRSDDDAEVFRLLEEWKARVFRDVYRSTSTPAMVRPVDLGAVLERLRPDEVLVSYFVSPSISLRAVLDKSEGLTVEELRCPNDEILSLARQSRAAFDLTNPEALRAIRKDDPSGALQTHLATLGRCLFDGMSDLRGKVVVVAPDEDLFGLPWPALEVDGAPLSALASTALVPSISFAMEHLEKRSVAGSGGGAAEMEMLVLAALGPYEPTPSPDSLSPPTAIPRQLPRLRGGVREVKSVDRALSRMAASQILVDRGDVRRFDPARTEVASKEAFLEKMPDAKVVHVIAHGLFDPVIPMQSSLLLSSDFEARLKAIDLAKLDLSKVQLVTLSSCDSGVVDGKPGSEPVGFVRAVLGAGSDSVLLARWRVDDAVTTSFMGDFYAALEEHGRAEALRLAREKVRRKFEHPYFWASFVLQGGWGELN
ncbi:MAG: CHAT domain-containing protein [Acidobacteriota bacterium]